MVRVTCYELNKIDCGTTSALQCRSEVWSIEYEKPWKDFKVLNFWTAVLIMSVSQKFHDNFLLVSKESNQRERLIRRS